MKFTLAISTCPNDTFIFDGLVNRRIDSQGFEFDVIMTDIKELNDMALSGEADIIKVSFAVYPFISSGYQLLTSGGALGRGVGPLVISKRKIYPDEVEFTRIAIPGEKTTANLLFSLAFPNALNKKVFLFSDIEEAILSNEVDVGVIIHENRFTYQVKGLKKIVDLGNFWEEKTGLPIPLGGIVVRRDLTSNQKLTLNRLVTKSVEYAISSPAQSYPFVKKYAQTMDDEIMQQHIDLYVNHFSVNLGNEGANAVNELFKRATDAGYASANSLVQPIFVQ